MAMEAIHKSIDDFTIFSKLIKDDIFYRIVSVTCYWASSYYVVAVITKISEKYLEITLKEDTNKLKIMTDYVKDYSILVPDDNLVRLFNGNRAYPKFTCDYDETNNLADSANCDLILSCGKSSGEVKWFKWKYDGKHDEKLCANP
ncbi:hypothetical protein RF11_08421 [Thelohanellus kitauei]|uniref:Uncharacterized protein n=1 Tax=Thelohanellus kitauei TaxID=669202 RepID=A0A0C2M7U8_THEKT|nr:hypothetical protein RF11_08421 [Thelohanellus kitauei]